MKTFLLTVTGACSLLTAATSLAEGFPTFTSAIVATSTSSSPPKTVLADAALEETDGYNRPSLPPQAPPKYAFGGFVSQSWVKTSKNINLSGPSDSKYGSFQRTEAGLFSTFALNSNIDFRGMVSTFKDGKFEDGTPQINYGLIDIHDEDSDFGVRLGYVSNSSGFYSEQLNIPAYRDFELAPQGIYRESYRHFARGGLGIQGYAKLDIVPDWSTAIELSHFLANVKDSRELSYTFMGQEDRVPSASSTISTLTLKARNFNLGLALRYDLNALRVRMLPLPGQSESEHYNMKIHRFGVRKYFEFGDLTVERSLFKFNRCGIEPGCVTPFGKPKAFDFVYRHYVTPDINFMIGYDTYYIASHDKSGTNSAAAFEQAGLTVNPASMYSKSINTALNWKSGKVTYKIELHHVKGQAALLATENDLRRLDLPRSYNILLLNMSYGF